jgi:hypothetical protein
MTRKRIYLLLKVILLFLGTLTGYNQGVSDGSSINALQKAEREELQSLRLRGSEDPRPYLLLPPKGILVDEA